MHKNTNVHMCKGTLPNGQSQSFYFSENHLSMPSWFKGIEVILCEHGLWPEAGLPAQCQELKCLPGHVDCCCHPIPAA